MTQMFYGDPYIVAVQRNYQWPETVQFASQLCLISIKIISAAVLFNIGIIKLAPYWKSLTDTEKY